MRHSGIGRRGSRTLELPDELRIHEGKKVCEIRPHVTWNKGFAIRKIAAHLEIPYPAVVFLGDDVTDEDAFRELGEHSITVHVGSGNAVSAARFNAEDPAGVVRFLQALL